MYDKSMIAQLLPSEMIIKNYIHGDPDCNYERYLLEFVNASDFFRTKSGGDIYQSPESEENGQCDCIPTSYQLDFKLIASKTALQAKSILYPSKTEIVKGVFVTSEPKVKNGSIKATRIHAALREYDFEGLQKLRTTTIKKQGVENDIIELLKTLETRKHLLLFFPYKFIFNDIIDAIKLVLQTQSGEFTRVTDEDFYISATGEIATEFSIDCTFEGFEINEAKNFIEWLSFEKDKKIRNTLAEFLDEHASKDASIKTSEMRLKSILESLSLVAPEIQPGLGVHNLLFIAAELLLLNSDSHIFYDESSISIVFDTVYGVKGETHDATLYLETETKKSSDIRRILPLLERKITQCKNELQEKSRRCVYVGFSRPKYLLCLAIGEKTYVGHEAAFSSWKIVDLRSGDTM